MTIDKGNRTGHLLGGGPPTTEAANGGAHGNNVNTMAALAVKGRAAVDGTKKWRSMDFKAAGVRPMRSPHGEEARQRRLEP
jgi:hypothetical protein